jgi:FtsP/CotA-like multicopper oxidase with cupredoxin domain
VKKIRSVATILVFGLLLLVGTLDTSSQSSSSSRVRTYYIAADEMIWDYLPNGPNVVGLPIPGGAAAPRQTAFRKAVYREYTDASFTRLKARPQQWQHLGILGPLIRAEVGDTVKVVFKNKTSIVCSMHPHGLAYTKKYEGAQYFDGLSDDEKTGARVPPGHTFTYIWTVPERAGPAHADASSVFWAYHSHFSETSEMNAGLIGPIIVTAKGMSKADGSPKDVDREFITAFAVFDEVSSPYFAANTAQTELPPRRVGRSSDDDDAYTDPQAPAARPEGEPQLVLPPFLMFSINGFLDGNLPMLTMKKGERVRWYLLSNGNEDDIHTPHWHGQTVTFMHMRMDMVNLLPMTMLTADMVPDTEGTWLFHCHVADHLDGGMVARFTVTP